MKRGMKAGLSVIISLVFLLFATSTNISIAENQPVVFQSTETPPYWSPALPNNGLGGSLLQLVSSTAGIEYSIEYLPVKRFRQSHATYIVGDPDLLMDKKNRAIFPIGVFHSVIFYYKPHHKKFELHSLKDLQGYTLGVLRGTLEDKDSFVKAGIAVEESDSNESLLKKLQKGRIDFCILVAGTGWYTIKQLFPESQENFGGIDITDSVRPIAIIIDKDIPEGKALARRYRQMLDGTLRSQEYFNILENFYGKNKIPADRFQQLKSFEKYYSVTW